MSLENYIALMLPALEREMQEIVALTKIPGNNTLYQMLSYHLGWSGDGAGESAQGKRIRPLLTLLISAAVGGNWESALPAAAAVELIHNFSLIHDDIEDNSSLRRGRQTLWVKHNLPIALNAGDAMYSLAYIAINKLSDTTNAHVASAAQGIISSTCLALTKGQHLDIALETAQDATIEDYWEMITGKTASLLAASTQLGALIGNSPVPIQNQFYQLGKNIGLAFQIQDDILGIWGGSEQTGKSVTTDLISRKKSLPILYGFKNENFKQLWLQPITPDNAHNLASALKDNGSYDYAKVKAEEYTHLALEDLQQLDNGSEYFTALNTLIATLINRTN